MAPYSGVPTAYPLPIDTSGVSYPESRARMYEPEIYRKRKLRKYSSSAFVSNGQRVALVEKKMSQRLNKDRVVRMQELYDSLYPVRTIVTETSFSMSTSVGQKMTCMNVFRHQDLDVLKPEAATTAVMTSGSNPWDGTNPLSVITNDAATRPLTQSGYVMRSYGVALKSLAPNALVVESQMHIGPGNHKPGLSNLDDTLYNQLVGNRYNVDTPRFTAVFDGGTGAENSQQAVTVQYPNLDVSKIGIGDIMGCCQTLWSPICCQSIEAASANLGFNALGTGTTSQIGGHLTRQQASSSDIDIGTADFGPETPSRDLTDTGLPPQTKVVPRGALDPESACFTWTKHSVDYKFNNTYNYPLDVEVVVMKAHGLHSRQIVTEDDPTPTAFYPGVNGPLPWTNASGGFFSVLYGNDSYNANRSHSVNRSYVLDFIGQWTSKLGASQRKAQGIQLPLSVLPAGYPNDQTSIGRFQKAAMSHWPLANARWRNFGTVKGQSAGNDFLREFSRKSIRIRPGEQCSMDLDLGGFKYSLADVGYLMKQVTTSGANPSPFSFPTFTTDSTLVGKEQYKFSSKGLMNGSIVVCITLRGTPMTANAPLLAVGPSYPTTQYGTASIAAGPNPAIVDTADQEGTVPATLPPTSDQVPRGNYATGVTHSAGTLLVECREKVSFQPMMNKRDKFRMNTVTNTNHSLLITPTIPVDATVRTVDSVTLKTYTNSTIKNSEDSRQTVN